jgi:Flp pilus assembly protein TadD
VYADEVRFWEAVLARSPRNARAHNNLAVALAERCRAAEAEAALRRALELERGYARAAVNLSLLREGQPLGPGGRRCGPAP